MSDEKKSNAKIWLAIGAIVLIVLLLLWLTIADFAGDTDVTAQLAGTVSQLLA